MLGDHKRPFGQFDLLGGGERAFKRYEACGVEASPAVLEDFIDPVRRERSADAGLASLLSAGLPLAGLAVFVLLLGLDDVAGRRLGRVARVLLQTGDSFHRGGECRPKLGVLRLHLLDSFSVGHAGVVTASDRGANLES